MRRVLVMGCSGSGKSTFGRNLANTLDLPLGSMDRIDWQLGVMSYGTVRPEVAPGCPERFDWAFWRYVWTHRAVQRSKLLAYFAALRADQRLVTFTARAQARAFLADLGAA